MKLRSFDNFLLKEAEESNAHREAVKMGLQYKGFGYWSDPRTGQITHQTQGGELKPYQGTSAEMAPDSNNPDSLKNKPGMQDDPTGPRQAPGTGILKAPEPGTEQHPRGANWNPGPDGDNCVNDQPPPQDLAYDTFVGKTNYYKWTAGSDGSNFKNVKVKDLLDEPPARREHKEHSFFTFLSEGPMAPTELGNPTPGGLGGMTPSEKAKQMGLKSDGHGSWRDQQGNIVARTVNGELVFYEPGGGAVSDSGGGSDMVMAKPTWTDPVSGMAITPPSKPETPEEIAAVPAATPSQAPADYERFMNQRKLDQYNNAKLEDEISQQQQEVDQKYAQNPVLKAIQINSNEFINQAYESGDEDEIAVANHLMDVMVDKADQFKDLMLGIPPDVQPDLANELTKLAEREARLRNLEADEGPVTDSFEDAQNDVEDRLAADSERELIVGEQQASLEALQKQFDLNMENELKDLEGRKKSNREKIYEKFREKLSQIPDEASRASFIQSVNHANTFIGRPNTGKGKNNLGFADIQTLKANRGRLIAGYADGDYEKVEEFVRSARPIEVSDEMVDLSFGVLPESFKRSLRGKGNVGGSYKGHFLGYNEDGTDKRGGTGNDDRAKLMWRIMLEQGMKDAYTGLPLELNSMDLEHVVGFNNKDYGKPTREDKNAREHERNMVMINTNINQKKMDMNMTQFFESQVNPLEDWTEDQYQRRDDKYGELNRIIDTKEQLAAMLIKNGDLDQKMTGDVLMKYFDSEEQENKAFNKSLSVGKKNNKELAEVDTLKSALGKKLFQAAGFSTGLTKPSSGRGTNSIKEDGYYRGMMVSYASLDKQGREHFRSVYNNAFEQANVQAVQALKDGRPIKQKEQRDIIVEAMNRSGLIDNRVYANKGMSKIWGKGDMSYDKMFKSEADKQPEVTPGPYGDFESSMNNILSPALESGDKRRIQTSENIQKVVSDNQEQFQKYYDSIPANKHKELTDELTKYSISKGKEEWLMKNEKKMSEDEFYQELQNLPSAQTHLMNIESMYEKSMGVKDYNSKSTKKYQNQGGEYTSGNNSFNLESTDSDLDLADPEQRENDERLQEIQNQANKIARNNIQNNKWKNPTKMMTVTLASEKSADEKQNRSTAIDALRLWRNEVMPSLQPGTILRNDPYEGEDGNSRERIYSLAGFGDYDESLEGQYAVVIQDENGNNKLAPIGKTTNIDKKKRKLKEDVMILLDYMVTEDQECLIYEALFQ